MLPVTIAVGLIALLAPLYMAFFVNYLDLGLYGAPIATGDACRIEAEAARSWEPETSVSWQLQFCKNLQGLVTLLRWSCMSLSPVHVSGSPCGVW